MTKNSVYNKSTTLQVTGTFEYSVINTVFGHLTNLTSISVWYISQCLHSVINTVFGHLNNLTSISVWNISQCLHSDYAVLKCASNL
jgi:hypothetical protein